MTAREQFAAGLKLMLEAVEAGALEQAPAPVVEPAAEFVSVEEAASLLPSVHARTYHGKLRAIKRHGKGKPWLRRDGRLLLVERAAFQRYVRSLPTG